MKLDYLKSSTCLYTYKFISFTYTYVPIIIDNSDTFIQNKLLIPVKFLNPFYKLCRNIYIKDMNCGKINVIELEFSHANKWLRMFLIEWEESSSFFFETIEWEESINWSYGRTKKSITYYDPNILNNTYTTLQMNLSNWLHYMDWFCLYIHFS